MSEFLSRLSRGWWSVELPGFRPHPNTFATYSKFATELLPPVPSAIGNDFSWLGRTPFHDDSTLASAYENAMRDLSLEGLDELLGTQPDTAIGLRNLVRKPDLRRHLRSATDCYFDLGTQAVDLPGGGRLVHFLSDSQWCRHWLLYADDSGSEAVLVTEFPAGFELAPDDLEVYPDKPEYEICAGSFLEFIWRFWIENEIWYALTLEDHACAPAELQYLDHYRRMHSAPATDPE